MLPVAAMVLLASPAAAQEADRFCPNRPSLGASGCTTLPGHVQVEVSALDWERDDQDDARTDTLLYGDVLARIGVDRRTEVQLGWTPLASVRTRDRATGAVSRITGTGDTTVAIRRALSHPDGKGLSTALQPFVVLPTGRSGVGDGDWSAGMTVPVAYRLTGRWSLGVTGEASAQADEDGHGRHFNASGIVGVGYAISDSVTADGELYLERDRDPSHHATRALAAASVAWQPGGHTQVDVLAVAGLNHDSPDLRIVVGGALLF